MHETKRPEPTRFYRWMVLVFLSLAMFGSYYAYDALSPLADVLKVQLGFSDENIGFLQAIYSFPNIFTVVIGGFIIRPPWLTEGVDDLRCSLPGGASHHGCVGELFG